MPTANGDDQYHARRWWVAFCSGWWLAGTVFGVAHGVELSTRPGTSTSELLGVPLVMGVLLPGARPMLFAAESLGVTGLPIGFTAILIGAAVGAIVWASLPLVLYRERRDANATDWGVPPPSVAAVPYLAAWPGVSYLGRTGRWSDGSRWWAVGSALATATVAYLVGAVGILAFGLVLL